MSLILSLMACAPVQEATAPPAAEAEPEARRLIDWEDDPENLNTAITLLEEARGREEGVWILTLLAQAYYLRGVDIDIRERAVQDLETAIARSDRALAISPGHVAARYWRAVSMLAKAGKLRGIESLGLVRQAVRELEAVGAADPLLDSAGAHRVLGKLYLESPWWFMGDTEKAVEHLESARRLAPHFLKNRLILAEAYAEDGRDKEALREIEDLLKLPPTPGHAVREQEARDLARRLAERIRARQKDP